MVCSSIGMLYSAQAFMTSSCSSASPTTEMAISRSGASERA